MTPEQLFFWTMTDVAACVRSPWHYHQLRLAILIRTLILDGTPLVHIVNRKHQVRLEFTYLDSVDTERASKSLIIVEGGTALRLFDLLPERNPSQRIARGALDNWRNVTALTIDGAEVSVKRFLNHMAYVNGIVHVGTPRDNQDSELMNLRESAVRLFPTFANPALDLLRQIGEVTHTGLAPLLSAIPAPSSASGRRVPLFNYS